MSSSPSHQTDQSNAVSHKRPRHFHQGPDEAEEKREEAAAAQPPAARLYRHALESIFGFPSLADLSRVLTVSRSWFDAVGSMRSISATVRALHAAHPLHELCASGLAHHVGTLGSAAKPILLTQAEVYLARFRMSGLHTLCSKLPSPLIGPLLFPPSLTELTVQILPGSSAQDVNSVIFAASRLSKLVTFNVDSALTPHFSFAPLRPAVQLRTLAVAKDEQQQLNQRQADELRAISNLTELNATLRAPDLRLLLRAPHRLKWLTITFSGSLDDELAGLLASLPKLTELNSLAAHDEPLPEPEWMIQGLNQCSQLTHLTIYTSPLTSACVSALLSRMPAVSDLWLHDMPKLESLSSPSSRCNNFLIRTFKGCFSDPLNSFTISELQPPSRHLPKLRSAVIE